MNINKRIKSVVITYEDAECVEITGQEAGTFQDILISYHGMHHSLLLDQKYSWILERVPITLSDLNCTIIRHGLQDDNIIHR